jgi:hypothetical protein
VPPVTWRFDPLDPRRFPVGEGPFRVRGVAFEAAMHYVDRRVPGGREGLVAALGPSDPFAGYFSQIFVAAGDYDASPLVRLYEVCARLVGEAIGPFIEARGRASAPQDATRTWKPIMKTSSPEAMAERLPLAYNRFFAPSTAAHIAIAPGRFEAELSTVPAPMNGLYVCSTHGWVPGALELAGARNVQLTWEQPRSDGELHGVPVERVRFVASWR